MCYFGATTETDLDQSSFTEGNGKKHISGEIEHTTERNLPILFVSLICLLRMVSRRVNKVP